MKEQMIIKTFMEVKEELNLDDEDTKYIKLIHIDDFTPELHDTIFHDGHVRTVGRKDVKTRGFYGTRIFGDSYKLGLDPVVVIDLRARHLDKVKEIKKILGTN